MKEADRTNLYLCLGIILALSTGACSAQPPQPMPSEMAMGPDLALDAGSAGGRMMHKEELLHLGVPVEMVVGGRGFALQNNQTHLLRLSIVRLVPMGPGQIRNFLVANKSIQEIKEAIKAEESQALYQGSLKLDEIVYPLTNISVRTSEDNATIADADLALSGSSPANQSGGSGYLFVKIYSSKGGKIGQGQLEMNSSEHKGRYQILLDIAGHAKPFEGRRNHR